VENEFRACPHGRLAIQCRLTTGAAISSGNSVQRTVPVRRGPSTPMRPARPPAVGPPANLDGFPTAGRRAGMYALVAEGRQRSVPSERLIHTLACTPAASACIEKLTTVVRELWPERVAGLRDQAMRPVGPPAYRPDLSRNRIGRMTAGIRRAVGRRLATCNHPTTGSYTQAPPRRFGYPRRRPLLPMRTPGPELMCSTARCAGCKRRACS
jgi:hypothetical protein